MKKVTLYLTDREASLLSTVLVQNYDMTKKSPRVSESDVELAYLIQDKFLLAKIRAVEMPT